MHQKLKMAGQTEGFFGAARKKKPKNKLLQIPSLIPPYDGPACKASKQCNFSHKINHRMLNLKAWKWTSYYTHVLFSTGVSSMTLNK